MVFGCHLGFQFGCRRGHRHLVQCLDRHGVRGGLRRLLIVAAVFCAYLLATGNATVALFAVAMAGIGLLTTVGVIVSVDSFGPVTDNAQGIAEMSRDVEFSSLATPYAESSSRI